MYSNLIALSSNFPNNEVFVEIVQRNNLVIGAPKSP